MIQNKTKPATAVFGGVFIFLLVYRWQAITYPPYWDSVLGIFHEAIWLAEHGFDYLKLAKEQPSYLEGGARVYFWTLYPGLQAVLMKLTPSTTAHFVVAHLLTYAAAAGMAVTFFKLCAQQLSGRQSALVTVALMTSPLVLAQAYALNMEILVVFLCFLALWCFRQGKTLSAGAWLLLAFYVKSSSCVMTLSLMTVYLVLRVGHWRTGWPMVLMSVPLVMVLVHGQIEKAAFRKSPSNLGLDLLVVEQLFTPWIVKEKVLQWFRTVPDVTVIIFVTLILAGIVLLGLILRSGKEAWSAPSWGKRMALWRERLSERETELCCLVFGAAFVALAILMRVWIPRYMFTVLPFMLLLLALVSFRLHARLGAALFVVIVVGNVLNAHGKLYTQPLRNQGYIMERSLEYETDMELNLALANKLQNDYADKMIVTYWPHVQMLSHPALGYVSERLNVVAGRRPVMRWNDVPVYKELSKSERHGPNVIWVDPDNVFSSQPALSTEQGDVVLEEVTFGSRSIKIWQRAY